MTHRILDASAVVLGLSLSFYQGSKQNLIAKHGKMSEQFLFKTGVT